MEPSDQIKVKFMTSENTTSWIQQQIEAVHQAGGGRVAIPAGKHICGTLYLRSGVHLHLEHGATILGSTDLSDYPLHTEPCVRSFADWRGLRSLIYAESAEDIALTGYGVIDGRGEHFDSDGTDKDGRPRLIQMIGCKDVRIEGLHLRNSGLWLQHYLGCERLRVHGLTAWNHVRPNNDFIDVEGCRDVRISDCTSDTDDDGITLKSGCAHPTEDVVVTNCVIRAHCNAIKCGTESNGGFRNITISNCVVAPSAKKDFIHGHPHGISAISLEIVDGGTMENVNIHHIAVRGTESPIFIKLGCRNRPYLEGGEAPATGRLRGVNLSNISVREAGAIGCILTGFPEHPIEDITLRDIRLHLQEPAPEARLPSSVPEKAEAYPEATMFGHGPAAGFFIRHARGIRLENLQVHPHADDPRPDLVTEDCQALEAGPEGRKTPPPLT